MDQYVQCMYILCTYLRAVWFSVATFGRGDAAPVVAFELWEPSQHVVHHATENIVKNIQKSAELYLINPSLHTGRGTKRDLSHIP